MTPFAYSVVEMDGGVGHSILHTDSLAHARQKVLRMMREGCSKTVFIMRNDPPLDPEALRRVLDRL